MDMSHDMKLATAIALEDVALDKGIERYIDDQDRKEKRDGYENRKNVASLIRGAIPILSEAIKDWLELTATKKGRKPMAYPSLLKLDPDLLAYIALTNTFHQMPKGGLVRAIAIHIGKGVMRELEGIAISEMEGDEVAKLERMAQRSPGSEKLLVTHSHIAATADVALDWDDRQCLLTGDVLLNLILTDLVEVFKRGKVVQAGHPHPSVVLTDAAAELLAKMQESAAWLRPVLQPMVTPPRPWTTMHTGCYNDARLATRVPLVRTFLPEGKKLVKEAIENGSMDMVLASTNALQATRFAIDTRVLDVMLWARAGGHQPSKSFPATETPEIPSKLAAEEWAVLTQEHRAALTRKRRDLRLLKQAAAVNGATCAIDLEMAGFLADEEVFYLPHSLDFRGRSYAVPHFNHQRSDHIKALFCFADAEPLGPEGGDWLMIHLANCGDFDKMTKQPFENRIDWCHDNEAEIIKAAQDPQGSYEFWSQADSPFCFLQACFEYSEWMQSGFSEDFMSCISGSADGSCSGLQHYSAITRAEKEAYHVNLLPRDTVGDIYNVVADEALPALEAVAAYVRWEGHSTETDKEIAKAEADALRAKCIISIGFGRNTVKRNVMTYFYGSGRFGMRDQHMQDTMRPLADEVSMGKLAAHPYEFEVTKVDDETGEVTTRMDGGFGCANLLAGNIYNSVVNVAPKADEAATWIQAVAALLAHEGLSLIWTTPSGMPVVHRYSEYTSKVVNIWLHNASMSVPTSTDKVDTAGNILERLTLLIQEAPTTRVAKKRMRSASSPNVIHSMDGSHLQRTVAMAHGEGITHFMFIHDAFGTHLGNMGKLSRIVRQAFVDTYTSYCPITDINTYARSVLSDEGVEKLPPIPTKGNLDLEAVKTSLYAFA